MIVVFDLLPVLSTDGLGEGSPGLWTLEKQGCGYPSALFLDIRSWWLVVRPVTDELVVQLCPSWECIQTNVGYRYPVSRCCSQLSLNVDGDRLETQADLAQHLYLAYSKPSSYGKVG